MPDGSNIENLYEFETGLILPQNPIKQYESGGKFYTYSMTPNIDQELDEFIFNEIKKNDNICIMDDVVNEPEETGLSFFVEKQLLYIFNKREIYYLISKNNLQIDFIKQCRKNTVSLWHSIFLLTKFDVSEIKNFELSEENIISLCHGTKF